MSLDVGKCLPPSFHRQALYLCSSVGHLIPVSRLHAGNNTEAALTTGLYTGSLISVIFFPRLLKAHEDFASHSPATSVVLMCAFEDS